ncbi:hypothetical protein PUMCH_002841 [Australozyma saopauloensis]|uniref:Uncharacterized protein n=1 Tax=Australozyma saopauloensis TaxID=291208 RepID=A0AAX4HAZ5_9ASCO|nr:hypothetical protein PUMCH_002841 [[Candida] saopauloensis]
MNSTQSEDNSHNVSGPVEMSNLTMQGTTTEVRQSHVSVVESAPNDNFQIKSFEKSQRHRNFKERSTKLVAEATESIKRDHTLDQRTVYLLDWRMQKIKDNLISHHSQFECPIERNLIDGLKHLRDGDLEFVIKPQKWSDELMRFCSREVKTFYSAKEFCEIKDHEGISKGIGQLLVDVHKFKEVWCANVNTYYQEIYVGASILFQIRILYGNPELKKYRRKIFVFIVLFGLLLIVGLCLRLNRKLVRELNIVAGLFGTILGILLLLWALSFSTGHFLYWATHLRGIQREEYKADIRRIANCLKFWPTEELGTKPRWFSFY